MEYKNIIYTSGKNKGIAKITINRPEVRNALNTATRQELRNAIEEIKKDSSVRVVIITGAGEKAFISGADITAFKDATPITIEEYASTVAQQLFTDIESLSVPTIAMIKGFCLGGGVELAMCCDIRIASENAKFGQPEINLGIFPGAGGTQLIYTGKIIDAVEAEKIGLVDKVVPPERLEEEAEQLAETIASKSPLIIKLVKKVINRGLYTDLAAGLAYEKANFALCFATEDHIEGVTAFLEKRRPEFKGK